MPEMRADTSPMRSRKERNMPMFTASGQWRMVCFSIMYKRDAQKSTRPGGSLVSSSSSLVIPCNRTRRSRRKHTSTFFGIRGQWPDIHKVYA
eukprot:5640690-Pyramimonas_sp.AAC.1